MSKAEKATAKAKAAAELKAQKKQACAEAEAKAKAAKAKNVPTAKQLAAEGQPYLDAIEAAQDECRRAIASATDEANAKAKPIIEKNSKLLGGILATATEVSTKLFKATYEALKISHVTARKYRALATGSTTLKAVRAKDTAAKQAQRAKKKGPVPVLSSSSPHATAPDLEDLKAIMPEGFFVSHYTGSGGLALYRIRRDSEKGPVVSIADFKEYPAATVRRFAETQKNLAHPLQPDQSPVSGREIVLPPVATTLVGQFEGALSVLAKLAEDHGDDPALFMNAASTADMYRVKEFLKAVIDKFENTPEPVKPSKATKAATEAKAEADPLK